MSLKLKSGFPYMITYSRPKPDRTYVGVYSPRSELHQFTDWFFVGESTFHPGFVTLNLPNADSIEPLTWEQYDCLRQLFTQ